MTSINWRLLLVIATMLDCAVAKFNQRVFVDGKNAISFADALKNGFRIILDDDFIKTQLNSANLPTIFVSAIPLHSDEPRYSNIVYPEITKENDKQIKIDGLREHSWYYVCIEWESVNRHNETFGTSCKLYQTLDRFGKAADSIVTDLEIIRITDQTLAFRVRTEAEFPVRLTAYLTGGQALPAAQTFYLTRPSAIEPQFNFLRPDSDYGQLCVVEEPLVSAYTSMGRYIGGIKREKCYFDRLSTQPGHLIETMDIVSNEIKAQRHTMNSASSSQLRLSTMASLIPGVLMIGIMCIVDLRFL